MNEKVKFISVYLNNEKATFLELCERFNISSKTGYKYITRYKDESIDDLLKRHGLVTFAAMPLYKRVIIS